MLYNEKVFSVLLYVWIYISYKMLQAEPAIKKLTFVLFIQGEPVKKEDVFVAVKTCRKFHGDRSKLLVGQGSSSILYSL